MMSAEHCGICAFGMKKDFTDTDEQLEKDLIICRRHPPNVIADEGRISVVFPTMKANLGWCGEFKRRVQ